MLGFIIIGIVILIAVVLLQLSKVSALASSIKGERESMLRANTATATALLVFLVLLMVTTVGSALYYKNQMLGWGPLISNSVHGFKVDSVFKVTLAVTGIVFIVTQILLFWFSYKYRETENSKAIFFPHNTTMEYIWTGVPAVVMAFLVVKGLIVWNETMLDLKPGEEYMEIEATGYQFAWDIRYPGADSKLGTKNFRLIDPASNPLGQDWSDEKNIDDFIPAEIVLPVDTTVRVTIGSKDVLHNFYLPQFRVKMDAVPGLPTYFIFNPVKTTEEYREHLSNFPEWQVPADPAEPNGPQKWEVFDFELACAELCGKGHYSMRKVVKIVSKEEYKKWHAEQKSYYMSNVRNTDADPFKGKLLGYEITRRKADLENQFNAATAEEAALNQIIRLDHVFFNTGSASLSDDSKYELNNVARLMKQAPNVKIELSGHTDNQGDASANMTLSQARAQSVRDYLLNKGISADRLTSKGYGQTSPVESNDTAEGRQANRRTELKVISK